ncbi:MAG: DNA polymerase [Acidimicrobiia bacterium]|nr:DNA polymerase [Acidimicrobiia bacterium]
MPGSIDSGAGFERGAVLAVALTVGVGAAWKPLDGDVRTATWNEAIETLRDLEKEVGPRWLWWSGETARTFVANGIRPARCWDLEVVYRLLAGGWRAGPGRVWADANGLDADTIPERSPVDLFHQPTGEDDRPVRADGHLDPEWVAGKRADTIERLAVWVDLALRVHSMQADRLGNEPAHAATARSESAAGVLCAELETDGLPIDRPAAETVISSYIGPRPTDARHAEQLELERDHLVLRHAPAGSDFDLRNPGQVKSLLRRVGVEVPDTRASRLEGELKAHPIVPALLTWRKAERIATTFGYGWLDEHVGPDGRLRGSWAGSDGAAGRMTATAGLHNMPADLRPAIIAGTDHVFVRADLGQIEPRVLAAVSGDEALARASRDNDMYQPVAERLRVEREIAKVAVLGAMYGQTTGKGAEALAGLERGYPVAMGYLRAAAESAQGGHDLRTYGGRCVRMSGSIDPGSSDRDGRTRAAARGRYGRNAMVQGAAAELFKTWAVIVRARTESLGARIVLCLHDELLVHTPAAVGDRTAAAVDDALEEAASRWAPPRHPAVRFVADTSVIERWSDAK